MQNNPAQKAIGDIILDANQPLSVGDILDRLPQNVTQKQAMDELDRLLDQGMLERQDTMGDVTIIAPSKEYLHQLEEGRHEALENQTRGLPEEERAEVLDQDPDYMLEKQEDQAQNQHAKAEDSRMRSARAQAGTKGELHSDEEAALLASRHSRHDHKKV
jgi:Fe2+ or Zn2+ uptake regulation protein